MNQFDAIEKLRRRRYGWKSSFGLNGKVSNEVQSSILIYPIFNGSSSNNRRVVHHLNEDILD